MLDELLEEPDSGNIDKATSLLLATQLNSLPDDLLAVIVLSICGFKQQEIAFILGVSRTTVWTKRVTALEELRKGFVHGEIISNGVA